MLTERRNRSNTMEKLQVEFLLHLGFSKSLIAQLPLRGPSGIIGNSAVISCADQIGIPLAYKKYSWPNRPARVKPGQGVRSYNDLVEYSILGSVFNYLYGDKVFEGISLPEVINAYNMYSNIRRSSTVGRQISPDTAFYIARELYNHYASLPWCSNCDLVFYSSADQLIVNVCPFCKEKGVGDFTNIED